MVLCTTVDTWSQQHSNCKHSFGSSPINLTTSAFCKLLNTLLTVKELYDSKETKNWIFYQWLSTIYQYSKEFRDTPS